jgi:hypothetical protein
MLYHSRHINPSMSQHFFIPECSMLSEEAVFLNAACLVKRQQIHILLVNWVDLTRSTTMKSSTLTMTSQKQKIKLW